MSATRSYGPSLSVGAQVGWQYYQFQEFDSIEFWGASANASLPVFSGGRIAGSVRAARANETVASHNLRGAALSALQEVRAALVADQAAQAQLDAVLRQHEAAKAAYQEARTQYQRGVVTYVQVLPILIASQVAESSVIDAKRQRTNARVQLHDALGGTWPTTLTSDGATP